MATETIPQKAMMKFELSKEMGSYSIYNLNPSATFDKFDLMATGINAFQSAVIKDLHVKIEYNLQNM